MSEELKLDVFISWSGTRAGAIANELKEWLTVAFQFTRPFLSKEIGAGKRWSHEVATALDRCNFGILILTPESVNSEWLLFEAGALAKHLGESRVVPVLADMHISALRPPLSDFQAIRLETQLYQLAESLNQAQPDPWPADQLKAAFEWTGKQFLSKLQQIKPETRTVDKQVERPVAEVLDEILQTVKIFQRAGQSEPTQADDLDEKDYTNHAQYYPVNDRIKLYKFLKARVQLPPYKNASMPALFNAAARFIQRLTPSLDDEKALSVVAKHLISERPLQELLEGLGRYEAKSA